MDVKDEAEVIRWSEKRVGSTGAPAIAGTSKFQGPWEVYNELSKKMAREEADHLDVGLALEPVLLNAIQTMDPRWLVLLGLPEDAAETFRVKPAESIRGGFLLQKAADGQAAVARRVALLGPLAHLGEPKPVACHAVPTRSTPDGKITLSGRHHRPVFSIEAKCIFYSDESEWKGALPDYDVWADSGDAWLESIVPAQYYDQCQWHMYHAGTPYCLLPVFFNYTSKPKIYVVKSNLERRNELFDVVSEFWHRYIIGDETPPPDASEGMKYHIAQKKALDDQFKPATPEDVDLFTNLKVAQAEKKVAEVNEDAAKNLLRESSASKGGIGIDFSNTGSHYGRLSYKENKRGVRVLTTKGVRAQ